MSEPKVPETLEELCDWIETQADRVHVREKVDRKWGNYKLTELSADRAIHHALQWVRTGHLDLRDGQQ